MIAAVDCRLMSSFVHSESAEGGNRPLVGRHDVREAVRLHEIPGGLSVSPSVVWPSVVWPSVVWPSVVWPSPVWPSLVCPSLKRRSASSAHQRLVREIRLGPVSQPWPCGRHRTCPQQRDGKYVEQFRYRQCRSRDLLAGSKLIGNV